MNLVEEGRGGGGTTSAPHGILLAIVMGFVVAGPFIFGDQGQAIVEAIPELLSPTGLFLLPVALILVIRFLSSDRGNAFSDVLSAGSPDSIYRVGGSPVGVALVLLLLVVLLYYRVSFFSDGDSDE